MLEEMVKKAKSRLSARALLRKQGFDPDDLNKKNNAGYTPIFYFIWNRQFAMVQYLIARGGDRRKRDKDGNSPLYLAASFGHLDVCQWLLHDGGAHEDIRHKHHRNGDTPLRCALQRGHFDVAKLLILSGALPPTGDDEGGIDDTTMWNDFRPGHYWCMDKNIDRTRLRVISWARDTVTTHDNDVQLLLTGMITSSKRMASPLAIFNGQSGILKLIADYGVAGSPQQLRALRQLLDRLPAFIKDVPSAPLRYR